MHRETPADTGIPVSDLTTPRDRSAQLYPQGTEIDAESALPDSIRISAVAHIASATPPDYRLTAQ